MDGVTEIVGVIEALGVLVTEGVMDIDGVVLILGVNEGETVGVFVTDIPAESYPLFCN